MTTHITVGRVPPDFAIPDVSEPAPSVPRMCNPALCGACSGFGCGECCGTGIIREERTEMDETRAQSKGGSMDDIRERHRTVPELVSVDPDNMCPNCCTPWKCNGPHTPEVKRSGRDVCHECGDPWPCHTRIVLDALDKHIELNAEALKRLGEADATTANFNAAYIAARADADRLAHQLLRLMPSEYMLDMSDDHDLIEIGSPKHVFADCREALRQHDAMSHTRDTTPPSVADTAQSTPAEPAQSTPCVDHQTGGVSGFCVNCGRTR